MEPVNVATSFFREQILGKEKDEWSKRPVDERVLLFATNLEALGNPEPCVYL